MQIFHDNGLFHGFPNANEVFLGFLLVERHRHDLDLLIDVVHWFCPLLRFKQ